MKTQAWTLLTVLALTTGIVVNVQSQDSSNSTGRIKLSDASYAEESAPPHVIGSPQGNSGSVTMSPYDQGGAVPPPGGPGNAPAFNNQYPQFYNGPGMVNNSQYLQHPQSDDPYTNQYRLGYRNGGFMGYNRGYTDAAVFMPFAQTDGKLWFVEPHVRVIDNGSPGASVGLGRRSYSSYTDAVMGTSVWWDYDDGNEYAYNQFGTSFSYMSRYWRFRANGYYVAGDKYQTVNSQFTGPLFYQNYNILRNQRRLEETAYNGVDAEIGGPIPVAGIYGFNWAAGAYYLDGKGDEDAVGVKGRLESQINEDWMMNVSISDDKVFGTNLQIGVQYSTPTGAMPARWFRQYDMYKYLATADERNYRVSAHQSERDVAQILINPADNQPYQVAHIVPSTNGAVADTGTGTYENPFNSTGAYGGFATPEQFDIILVRGSDANGTNLDDGIRLYERQRLLSTSVTHNITGLLDGVSGTFQLPETGVGITPILSNVVDAPGATTSVVTIDPTLTIDQFSLTEISGFTINGVNTGGPPLNMGISGVGDLDGGINVNRNTFLDTRIGVNFINSTDVLDTTGAIFEDNTVTGAGLASLYGFNIEQNTGSNLNMYINNNTITGVEGEDQNGDGILDLITEDTGDADGSLAGNGNLDAGIGINIVAADAGTTINMNDPTNVDDPLGFLNNTITNNGIGVNMSALAGGNISVDIQGNDISSNITGVGTDVTGAGMILNSDAAGSNIDVNTLTDNIFNNNTGHGLFVNATTGGTVNFLDAAADGTTFDGNTFNGNTNDGMNVNVQGAGSAVTIANLGDPANTVVSNTFNGNTLNGFNVNVDTTGSFEITNPVVNNQFNTNGTNGFLATVSDLGSLYDVQIGDISTTVPGNTFNGNGTGGAGSGFRMDATDNPTILTSFYNSTFNNNTGGHGIEMNLTNLDAVTLDAVTITNTQELGNGLNGIYFNSDNSVITNLNIVDNAAGGPPGGISGNTQNGIAFNLLNGTVLDTTLIDGNNIANNGQNGIEYIVNNSDILANIISGNVITGQVNGNGIFVQDITGALPLDTIEMDIVDNNISSNLLGAGVLMDISRANVTSAISGNTINANGQEGIGISLANTSTFTTNDFDDNLISNNGSYGLRMSGTNQSNFLIDTLGTPLGNTFDFNTDAGILMELAENATGTLIISNTVVSNTQNGVASLDDGDGIRVRLTGDAHIDQVTLDNVQTNLNRADGVAVTTQGNSYIENMLLTNGTASLANSGNGLSFERSGNSTIGSTTPVLLDATVIDGNLNNGISVVSEGGVTAFPGASINIQGNNMEITDNSNDGVNVLVQSVSSVNFGMTTSLIDGNGNDGIQIESRQQGTFRGPTNQTDDVVWDGLIVTNNGAHGVNLITPDFAGANGQGEFHIYMNGDSRLSEISNNGGYGINYVSDASNVNVNEFLLGNSAFVPTTGRPFDVIVNGNTSGGMNIDQGSGSLVVETEHVLFNGLRESGSTTDVGINIVERGNGASAITLTNSVVTNFGGDGIHIDHDSLVTDSAAVNESNNDYDPAHVWNPFLLLTLNSTDVGVNDFSFNGGDGIDANIQDSGANIVIQNGSNISNNRGSGINFRTDAEDFLNGRRVTLTQAQQNDGPDADALGDTVYDGFPLGNTFLNSLDYYYSVNASYANGLRDSFNDLYNFHEENGNANRFTSTNVPDVIANLTINGGSTINFNGLYGVNLEVGTSTRQNIDFQNSFFLGNSANQDISFRPLVSGQPDEPSSQAPAPNATSIELQLDPVAQLHIVNFTNNTGNRIRFLADANDTVNGGILTDALFNQADGVYKSANRPAVLTYDVDNMPLGSNVFDDNAPGTYDPRTFIPQRTTNGGFPVDFLAP
jgi:hypothetical protein